MSSQKLTLAEFKGLCTATDEETRLDAYKPCEDDSYSTVFSHLSSIPKPRQSSVDAFLCSANYLSSDARSLKPVSSKYDINYTSLEDYLANWDILSREDQLSLRGIVLSDLHGNSNRFGLKKLNLESHLLLSLGCDMTNIVNNGKDAIASNLLAPESALGYSRACLDNRAVDAKTCLRASRKFNKEHSVEALFKSGFVAFQCVISSDESYRKADRERYQTFFRENAAVFALWLKRKKIYSYAYSHEVSVDSILGQKYRPHTHLIFFVPRSSHYSVQMLAEEFNSRFSDREMHFVMDEVDEVFYPRVSRKFKDIEKSFDYLHRCYSLADQYTREVRSENIQQLNRKVVETYHTLIELFRSDSIKGGVRRFKSSYIPSKDEALDYKHPLLQKKVKSNTIRKLTKVSTETTQEHDTTRQDSTAPSLSRKDCQGNACSPEQPSVEGGMESAVCLGRIRSGEQVCSTDSRESTAFKARKSCVRSGYSSECSKVRRGYASERVCGESSENKRASGRCSAKSSRKSSNRTTDARNASPRAEGVSKHDGRDYQASTSSTAS